MYQTTQNNSARTQELQEHTIGMSAAIATLLSAN